MDLFEIVEQSTKEFYRKTERHLPEVSRITFELSRLISSGKINLHGFIHIGNDTEIYNSIEELEELIREASAKRKILFKRFDRKILFNPA